MQSNEIGVKWKWSHENILTEGCDGQNDKAFKPKRYNDFRDTKTKYKIKHPHSNELSWSPENPSEALC